MQSVSAKNSLAIKRKSGAAIYNARYSPAKDIAYVSVMCAILIGGQYVFSFVAGVEIVTLLLVCFSYVFGARRGALCALAFSLLRCMIFGFYPTAVILYLAYYPVVAVLFGWLGRAKAKLQSAGWCVAVNILLIGVAAACAALYFGDIIKISRLYKLTLNVLLCVIFALAASLCVVLNGLFVAKRFFQKNTDKAIVLIIIASVAAVCTVCFTLLDDVITPLFFGYSSAVWAGYVYSSFTAMLPQTVCAVVSVVSLFIPVTAAMRRAVPSMRKIDFTRNKKTMRVI